MPKNVGDLGKLIVAKGFKKSPKVQKIANSGHTVLEHWNNLNLGRPALFKFVKIFLLVCKICWIRKNRNLNGDTKWSFRAKKNVEPPKKCLININNNKNQISSGNFVNASGTHDPARSVVSPIRWFWPNVDSMWLSTQVRMIFHSLRRDHRYACKSIDCVYVWIY